MPPQNNNQTNNSSPNDQFSMESMQKNTKLMDTIKIFVVYGTILYLVRSVISMLVVTMFYSGYYPAGYSTFSFGAIIGVLIMGAIGSAIGAIIFYFLYGPIHNWIKSSTFLSKHIYDMFTLFWKPFILVTIISAVFGFIGILGLGSLAVGLAGGYGALSFGSMLIVFIINLVINIALYYYYAKTVSVKLLVHYPW